MTLIELNEWLGKATCVDSHGWQVDKSGNHEGMNIYILDTEHENPDHYGIYFHNNGDSRDVPIQKFDEDMKCWCKNEYEIFKVKAIPRVIEIMDYEVIVDELY